MLFSLHNHYELRWQCNRFYLHNLVKKNQQFDHCLQFFSSAILLDYLYKTPIYPYRTPPLFLYYKMKIRNINN